MLRIFILFIAMIIFWLVVAGFSLPALIVGTAAVLFVLWLNRGQIRSLEANWQLGIKNIFFLALFGLSLLWQIVLANVQVAKILLNPKMPMQPGIVSFSPGLKTDLSKAILANSITLTPGTLTLDVQGDVFVVHALTLAAAQGIVEWPLISWLRKLEGSRE